jgi:hypothetical protein
MASSSRPPSVFVLALAAVVAASLSLAPGCKDPTVDVLRPDERFQFSLFGTLNVAADTQVIRVEPLDDSIQVGAPRNLDATVVLENLDSGEQISLQDSLTSFGDEPILVHNLWTTHPIEPATSYRVLVQREGEPVTTATTTTPAHPPTLTHTAIPDTAVKLPCTFSDNPNVQLESENTFRVTVQEANRIAAVEVTYPIPNAPSRAPRAFNHFDGVEQQEEGKFVISIFYRPDLVASNPNPPPPPQPQDECASRSAFARPFVQVEVAAGGPDWPQWLGVPINEIARPDTFSNVQGGHGFVGATYSDTVEVPVIERE